MPEVPGGFLSVADVLAGARFLRRLPAFLRHPVSLEEARVILRRRLERREADFLGLMKRAVFEYPASPYRPLLDFAGCEFGDFETLVRRQGIEGALQDLFRKGVYLTAEEFKGRQPVVRGSATLLVDPSRFRNPASVTHLPVRTGGSRDLGRAIGLDLGFLHDTAVDYGLALAARGGVAWRHAIWGVPGGAAMHQLLRFSGFGARPAHWFSQIDPGASDLHPRYYWSAQLMRWASLLAGAPLPFPVHVPLDDPLPIIQWIAGILESGGTPHLLTFASSAVRLCQAARTAGIAIRGAKITMSGEPTTPARLAEVRRGEVEAVPHYGNTEAGGVIAYGCLSPTTADDLHLFHDVHVMITPGTDGPIPALPGNALLLSSLRPTAPLVFLNVSLGDQAVLNRISCGCPLDRLGWTIHLHTVRSYEKLTTGGMSFPDSELVRVLEEVLPARFGGGPTDYQLVEDEKRDGQPRLRLLVHPCIGTLDANALVEAFLTAISPGSGAEKVMGLLWRQGGFLRVERRAPEATPGGKILHLRVVSNAAVSRPGG